MPFFCWYDFIGSLAFIVLFLKHLKFPGSVFIEQKQEVKNLYLYKWLYNHVKSILVWNVKLFKMIIAAALFAFLIELSGWINVVSLSYFEIFCLLFWRSNETLTGWGTLFGTSWVFLLMFSIFLFILVYFHVGHIHLLLFLLRIHSCTCYTGNTMLQCRGSKLLTTKVNTSTPEENRHLFSKQLN